MAGYVEPLFPLAVRWPAFQYVRRLERGDLWERAVRSGALTVETCRVFVFLMWGAEREGAGWAVVCQHRSPGVATLGGVRLRRVVSGHIGDAWRSWLAALGWRLERIVFLLCSTFFDCLCWLGFLFFA